MKTTTKKYFILCLCIGIFFQTLFAQTYNMPLTIQGLNNTTYTSAASRGLGGISLTVKNDVGLMFTNPASLQSLEGIQISVGGYRQYRTMDQTQMWFPSANYPNFSLLMAGLTDTLTLPVIDSATYARYFAVSSNNPSGADTIFRQFDNILSNWQYKKNDNLPLQIFLAVPFTLAKMKFVAGAGSVEYANLNTYYQNNNVLNPDPGKLYPQPFNRPLDDSPTSAVPIWWTQSLRKRIGSIYGYGGAISGALTTRLNVGVSGMFLQGSSNDYESIVGRGLLDMRRTFFSLGRYYYMSYQSGNSDYKGQEFTLSSLYEGNNLTVGFALKLPSTMKREYTGTLFVQNPDGTAASTITKVSDELKLPWRGSVGLGIAVRQNLSVKVEYEYLPFSTALYTKSDSSSNPWLDSYKFKVGLEYTATSWLIARCGYNKHTEVFATENYYIPTDPLSSESYSIGVGVKYLEMQVDLAYEYAKVSYEDMWTTNINLNNDVRQSIVFSISYALH